MHTVKLATECINLKMELLQTDMYNGTRCVMAMQNLVGRIDQANLRLSAAGAPTLPPGVERSVEKSSMLDRFSVPLYQADLI